MMQLHQDYKKFDEKDTIIVAIGPEKADKFKSFWGEHKLEFYGIPDESQSILKLYDQKINIFKLGRMPAQMLIDKNGVLKYVHFGHSMKDIPETSEMLNLIENL